MEVEAESGVKQPQAKEHLELPEPSEAGTCADTLISGVQPLELRENKLLLL